MAGSNPEKEGWMRRLVAVLTSPSERSRILACAVMAIGAMIYGLNRAHAIRWLCDDAFVTFRYVDNFLSGYGIVFNQGERVEGYTHFLWLCLLALLRWLGISLESAAIWLGLLSYMLTLALFAVISYRIGAQNQWTFPVVTAALALHYDFAVWATGGLETALFTLLVSLGFYTICFGRREARLNHLAAGLWLTLGMMTRPDGVVFWIIGLFFLLGLDFLNGGPRNYLVRKLFFYLIPTIVLFMPYVVWKILYYGDIFPNTYYAKSADLNYFDQGFVYIWTYVRCYASSWFLLLSIPFLVLAWKVLPSERTLLRLRHLLNDERARSVLLALLFVLVYAVGFVAKVGGDFMYARFLCPLIPFSFFLCEVSATTLLANHRRLFALFVLGLLVLVVVDRKTRDDFLSAEQILPTDLRVRYGIMDEHWFWTRHGHRGRSLIGFQVAQGKLLRPFFEEEKVSVLLIAQCSVAYHARFYNAIELNGLTDKYIAHLPIAERGRSGHEKSAPEEYIIRRKVKFVFSRAWDGSYRAIKFASGQDTVDGNMITYDPGLLQRLDHRFPGQISYVKFEDYLDDYIKTMSQKTRQQVEDDFREFNGYYFSCNEDLPRKQKILDYLGNAALKN